MTINNSYIAILGDSKTYQAGTGDLAIPPTLIAKGWSSSQLRVSGVSSRTPYGGTATPVVQTTWDAWQAEGFDPKVVVLVLGGNIRTSSQATWQSQFTSLYNMVEAPGRIIYQTNTAYQDANEAASLALNNWLFNTFIPSRNNPNIRKIDHYAFMRDREARGLPIAWNADGIHLEPGTGTNYGTGNGYPLLNGLIADAVASWSPTFTAPAAATTDWANVSETETFAGTVGNAILASETIFQNVGNRWDATTPANAFIRTAVTDVPLLSNGASISSTIRQMSRTGLNAAPTVSVAFAFRRTVSTTAATTSLMLMRQGTTTFANKPGIGMGPSTGVNKMLLRDAGASKQTGPSTTPNVWYWYNLRYRLDTGVAQIQLMDLATSTVLYTSPETAASSPTGIDELLLGFLISTGGGGEWARYEYSTEYKWITPPRQFATAATSDNGVEGFASAALVNTGSGAVTVTATVAGSGSRVMSGSGSTSVTATVAGTGSTITQGTGASTVTATVSGAGSRASQGTGSATVTATVAGSGTAPTVGGANGSGSVTVTATVAGSGTRTTQGSGSVTVTATVNGAGTTSRSGAGSVTVSATVTGSGTAPAVGAANGSGAVTVTATVFGAGARKPLGSGAVLITATVWGTGSNGTGFPMQSRHYRWTGSGWVLAHSRTVLTG